MKKSILFLSLLAIGFASCKKDDDDNTIYTPSYHVDGVTDLTLVKDSRSGSATPFLPLSITYENSVQERVDLSLENVPSGLFYQISTPGGIPTFSSSIFFADSNIAEGNYPIKLIAKGEYSGRKEFKFNMKVISQPDCTADIIGRYTTNSSCSGIRYTQDIVGVTGERNRVLITNLNNNGIQLFAKVDCEGQGLTIPTQTVNGITYEGSGSYGGSGGQQVASFFIQSTSGSSTSFCNYTLIK